uniref:Uncharacterized protein n=2 Tax=Anguilla anguilla TaxID=7936 RepID=A0A0E9TMY7_ANGAN
MAPQRIVCIQFHLRHTSEGSSKENGRYMSKRTKYASHDLSSCSCMYPCNSYFYINTHFIPSHKISLV